MAEAGYLEAMNKYYAMKREYDDKYAAMKNKLLKNPTLTMADKRRKLAQIKRKCVKCGKTGGTKFSNEDGVLTAVCGHVASPCTLDLHVARAKVMPSYEVLDKFGGSMEKTKQEIIETKFDMLFDYAPGDVAMKEFRALRKSLALQSKVYEGALDVYTKAMGTPEEAEQLRVKELERYGHIREIRGQLQEYSRDGVIGHVERAVEIYTESLRPLLEQIRDLKYGYVGMDYEETEDISRLVENVFTPKDMEYVLRRGARARPGGKPA
jgi:hypothetical protein